MTGFYANTQEEDVLELQDGTKIVLQKYMTAGMQEDINNEMVHMQIDNNSEEAKTAQIRMGNLKLIQMMVKRVEFSDQGKKPLTAPIGLSHFRNMDRHTYSMVLDRIFEHNRPLSEMRREKEEAADLME